jgi:hypothetical protein
MPKGLLFLIVPFCSIFIGIGEFLLYSTARGILMGAMARNWPYTNGRMVNVENKIDSESESNSREITVRYTYAVDGSEYEGSTIHPAYTASSFEVAHQRLESVLGSAKQIRVYYDRSKPSRSTLSVGIYSCSFSGFAGGFLFLSAGLGFLLSYGSPSPGIRITPAGSR